MIGRSQRLWCGAALVAAVTAASFPGVAVARAAEKEPAVAPTAVEDSAVAQGREALGARFGGYNWYDESQDASRPIDIRVPWDWSWEWNGPDLSGLGPIVAQSVKILAWGLLLGLVGMLAYFLIKAYLNSEGLAASATLNSRQAALSAARIEALPEEVRRDASDLLGAARRHYEQGNYREAMIYLFSHELVELDRRQRIRLTRGKTNRQYLSEASSSPPLAELFERSMVTFEAVFFGNLPLDRAGFEACWTQLPRLEQLARQEPLVLSELLPAGGAA